ncbi:MAG: hypothetical protein U0R80_07425 [Nocardioidaceae bacterium]
MWTATRSSAAIALLSASLLVAACPPARARASTDDVRVGFAGAATGAEITKVTNIGTADTTQKVVTAHGGAIVARRSTVTGNVAADYPDYDGARNGDRAVIAVSNATSTDELAPGAAAFEFGADLRLDATNQGTASDNGNNVFQRGLYGDTAQFKLQVDGNHVSCRVKGDLGAADVWSPRRLKAARWYRASCARQLVTDGDQLVLTLRPFKADGTLGTALVSRSTVTQVGNLSFDVATPLSIGGKLDPDLTVDASADQFNGRLDNAFLRIP